SPFARVTTNIRSPETIPGESSHGRATSVLSGMVQSSLVWPTDKESLAHFSSSASVLAHQQFRPLSPCSILNGGSNHKEAKTGRIGGGASTTITMERYLCIHGHFYQPPRETPWLEAVELQDSASPFHDWNERITAECYAPNGVARILDGDGRIARLI